MDLNAAMPTNGPAWRLARIGAILCFAIACGLLIGSLVSTSKAGNLSSLHQQISV